MNRNTFYATTLVDEFGRAGVEHVCLAPGSRNTPLVLAFVEQGGFKLHSHLDERSAAFFALGIAKATGKPAILVCSSGTAGANFYPAVIEAHQSRIPMIVLTADRPHELRHSGANQTIDQIKLYGDYAKWFVDAALPEADPSSVAVRNLRTMANRAVATSMMKPAGVVHINIPFRKPLEPTPVESDRTELHDDEQPREQGAYTRFVTPAVDEQPQYSQELEALIAECKTGIIICGPNTTPPHSDGDGLSPEMGVTKLAQATGFPVLADGVSGLRMFPDNLEVEASAYDSFLPHIAAQLPPPEMVIRLGDVPTSKAFNDYLNSINPKYHIHVTGDGVWMDDSHRLTHVFNIDPHRLRLSDRITPRPEAIAYKEKLQAINTATWKAIHDEIDNGTYFDGAAVFDLANLAMHDASLFVGNSMPVRLLDRYAQTGQKRLHCFANRGASGIDGNISTALGIGAGRPENTLIALVGDVTFYHDMNGLLAIQRCGVPLVIVLLNNNGGGIFHRLPISQYDPAFTDYFVTPHGLDFSHAAKLYGLDHVVINAADSGARYEFRLSLTASMMVAQSRGRSTIIELQTDTATDLQRGREVSEAVRQAVAEAMGS